MLGIREETRARIVAALWQYIKQNRLQDTNDRGLVNLNSELRAIFGTDEKIKFHQLMGLLKSHLSDCRPIELSIAVKRNTPRQRQFYSMPVSVNAETFKKALEFLVSHNYSFDGSVEPDDID